MILSDNCLQRKKILWPRIPKLLGMLIATIMAYLNILHFGEPETDALEPLKVPVEPRAAVVEHVAAPVQPVVAPVDKGSSISKDPEALSFSRGLFS